LKFFLLNPEISTYSNVAELSSLLASDNLPWVSYSLDTDSSSMSSGCTSSSISGICSSTYPIDSCNNGIIWLYLSLTPLLPSDLVLNPVV